MNSMSLRIRQCRQAARLSQAELAAKVGVRRSAVAQWERIGGSSPSVSHLAQLALTAGVSFEWIATGRGAMRLTDNEPEPTVLIGDFARNALENDTLVLLRRLPDRYQVMACRILASMSA